MAAVWPYVLTALLTVIGTIIVALLTRKKPFLVKSEDQKLSAEAHSLEVQTIKELLGELREIRAEVETNTEQARVRQEENSKREEFLRGQVKFHEELSIAARKAAHAAINEAQRCAWAIHLRDEAIKEWEAAVKCAEVLLADNGIKFEITQVDPVPVFEQTAHEDIVKYQSLPLPQ
jgi:hypothetical protein